MATNETLSVKKIPFYLFLVLIGFLIFYVFDIVRDKGNPNDGNNRVITKARKIPDDTAKFFIENYLNDQASLDPEYRLVTKKDEQLRGFWLSKTTLASIDKAIEKEDPKANVEGYNIYFGKADPADKRRTYNLVVRGSIAKLKSNQTGNAQKARSVSLSDSDLEGLGPYYDYIDPCPEHCGN
ncbi:MAG TPA: hypothetical protein PKE30_04830 [Niabella sp.]|nr:hypothetical protein [Niabella sp.]